MPVGASLYSSNSNNSLSILGFPVTLTPIVSNCHEVQLPGTIKMWIKYNWDSLIFYSYWSYSSDFLHTAAAENLKLVGEFIDTSKIFSRPRCLQETSSFSHLCIFFNTRRARSIYWTEVSEIFQQKLFCSEKWGFGLIKLFANSCWIHQIVSDENPPDKFLHKSIHCNIFLTWHDFPFWNFLQFNFKTVQNKF